MFLLTPALSLGERGNRSQFSGKATAENGSVTTEIYQHSQRLFPLPAGEGQGEGDRSVQPAVGLNEKPILRTRPFLKMSLLKLNCRIVAAVSAHDSGDKSHALQTLRADCVRSQWRRRPACLANASM